MAKEKPRKSYGIKKVEDKYVCEECASEVPIRKPCPTCKKEFDWEQYLAEFNRYQ